MTINTEFLGLSCDIDSFAICRRYNMLSFFHFTCASQLDVMTKRLDGVEFPISDSPVPLCDLLEKKAADRDSI